MVNKFEQLPTHDTWRVKLYVYSVSVFWFDSKLICTKGAERERRAKNGTHAAAELRQKVKSLSTQQHSSKKKNNNNNTAAHREGANRLAVQYSSKYPSENPQLPREGRQKEDKAGT
jgi:hypothetical protein